MAKMIPSTISPNVKSMAERKIFEWFKNDPTTKDWVVFHSLGIENHQTVVFGEIDFLVAASSYGVFSLEVKGGRISRHDGVWVYTDKYGVEHEKVRGPFEQASEGMYSVKEELSKRTSSKTVKNTLCGYGVMFPDIEYINTDIDVSQQQIFDKRDNMYVGRYIKRLAEYNKNKFKEKKVFVVYPNEDDIDTIVNVLRKDFDKALPISTKIEYAEKRIIELTDEQYRCIDGLTNNKRCIINGSAGTGKTILAIKNAKESVAQGKKLAFFCFNKLLANELKSHFNDFDEVKPSYVGSFIEFLVNLVKKYNLYDFSKMDNPSYFYREELPVLAIDALAIENIKFDKIILDEAQDLMNDNYLSIIDLLLNGGLKKGEWFFFGDFDYQTINDRNVNYTNLIDNLEDKYNFATFILTKNCRNTINIQKEMNYIVNINNETLNKEKNTPEVKYVQFNTKEDEAKLIEDEIKKLIANGIKEDEITLLSFFKYENSVAPYIKKYKINKINNCENKGITYSTIQGFKGLENTVIILTDILTYNKPDVMYVGMSRARSYLIVFEIEHAKNYRTDFLKKIRYK